MDASELELFERSVAQATERHSGDALDAALTELGWPDALAADPHTAVSVLFPRQGAAHAASSALDQVVLTGLGMPDVTHAVVLPALGTTAAPGDVIDGRLSIRGLGTAALPRAARAVVVARCDGDQSLTVATVPTSAITLRPVSGIDPAFGLVEVTADAVGVVDPGTDTPAQGWGAAVVLAQLALSHEILGAARAMLALAREHALDRVQFGQPISGFQAVRHRLAETLLAIEAADAAARAAREEPSPELAAIAKALAGRGGLTAARHCQQVLAGIGFTAEHSFHRYFRRILLLDQLFGSAHSLTAELGHALLESRRLPALLPL
jgi:alkylation response protein AidB-like acyl-CoA dehydrogenase